MTCFLILSLHVSQELRRWHRMRNCKVFFLAVCMSAKFKSCKKVLYGRFRQKLFEVIILWRGGYVILPQNSLMHSLRHFLNVSLYFIEICAREKKIYDVLSSYIFRLRWSCSFVISENFCTQCTLDTQHRITNYVNCNLHPKRIWFRSEHLWTFYKYFKNSFRLSPNFPQLHIFAMTQCPFVKPRCVCRPSLFG